MTPTTSPNAPRKTLGLTGVTINAMALTAPGAFLWLLYQTQSVASFGGAADIWPGVLLALLSTLLTALSFGELARRYPEAGFRSAYHFAERFFASRESPRHRSLARVAKFATGWSAHLYYWIYPGVIIAFMGILADYLLRYLGYTPTLFGDAVLAAAFAAFICFLALRGINGTTLTSVVLNTVQLTTLMVFSALALAFRLLNPAGFSPADWVHPSAMAVLMPHSLNGALFQGALATLLMVGFESSTALGASAANPQRDIPRGAVLALIIQGAFAYLLGYFAAGFALNTHINAAGSHAPIGDLAVQIGDVFLGGSGGALMLCIGLTVLLAMVGGTLTAVNNGVRISFAMALDEAMPGVMGFLHPNYATPYFAVILLGTVSALVGAAGIIGGPSVLMGIILASNLGAFLLYALLCILTVVAFIGDASLNIFRHILLPVIGLLGNLGMIVAALVIGLGAGGLVARATTIALAIAGAWFLLSLAYYLFRRAHTG